MKVIGGISDINEKLGGFHSACIILYSLGFDETGPKDMLRVLPGREQK
jgi:hypothetical protein